MVRGDSRVLCKPEGIFFYRGRKEADGHRTAIDFACPEVERCMVILCLDRLVAVLVRFLKRTVLGLDNRRRPAINCACSTAGVQTDESDYENREKSGFD